MANVLPTKTAWDRVKQGVILAEQQLGREQGRVLPFDGGDQIFATITGVDGGTGYRYEATETVWDDGLQSWGTPPGALTWDSDNWLHEINERNDVPLNIVVPVFVRGDEWFFDSPAEGFQEARYDGAWIGGAENVRAGSTFVSSVGKTDHPQLALGTDTHAWVEITSSPGAAPTVNAAIQSGGAFPDYQVLAGGTLTTNIRLGEAQGDTWVISHHGDVFEGTLYQPNFNSDIQLVDAQGLNVAAVKVANSVGAGKDLFFDGRKVGLHFRAGQVDDDQDGGAVVWGGGTDSTATNVVTGASFASGNLTLTTTNLTYDFDSGLFQARTASAGSNIVVAIDIEVEVKNSIVIESDGKIQLKNDEATPPNYSLYGRVGGFHEWALLEDLLEAGDGCELIGGGGVDTLIIDVLAQNSIEIDGVTNRLELDGDEASPDDGDVYAVSPTASTKGWQHISDLISGGFGIDVLSAAGVALVNLKTNDLWIEIDNADHVIHKKPPAISDSRYRQATLDFQALSSTLTDPGGTDTARINAIYAALELVQNDVDGHIWDVDGVNPSGPPEDNFLYEKCDQPGTYIVRNANDGQTLRISDVCWDLVGATSQAVDNTDSFTAFASCTACEATVVNYKWKRCDTNAVAGVFDVANNPSDDYAYICISSAWVACYEDSMTADTATNPSTLAQCGSTPTSCADLGWPADDDFGGTGCNSGTVDDTNWTARYSTDAIVGGTGEITGGEFVYTKTVTTTTAYAQLYMTGMSLTGDFDFRFDFTVSHGASGSGTDGVLLGCLGVSATNIQKRKQLGTEEITTRINGSADSDTAETADSGTLRIYRDGSTVYCQFDDGGGFTTFQSGTMTGTVTGFQCFVYGEKTGSDFDATIDNIYAHDDSGVITFNPQGSC
jgi:hypothetical protein